MPEFHYTNPITRDPLISLRDHQIIKVGDLWYMTGTSQPVWSGKNPGVRLLMSTDLLNWSHHSWIIDGATLPDDCAYNGRFWAPEIHRSRNKFWLTVNSGNGNDGNPRRMHEHGIHLLVADHVTGPYKSVTGNKPLGKPFKNDASLFTDDDGKTYLYASGGGLWQAEINLSEGSFAAGDDLQKICSPQDSGTPEWMVGGIEGPFVIKRGQHYYLFFSAWTRGYEIGVMQAVNPLGPWTFMEGNPIFGTRKRRFRERQAIEGGYANIKYVDSNDPFVETGHCAIFEGPDGCDWMCCHYFLEGNVPITTGAIIEFADTQPHLGIEPLSFQSGQIKLAGPTWTPQVIRW